MKHSSHGNGKLQPKSQIIFFDCFSVNNYNFIVLLALRLKCSGKTTHMPTHACRQPPPPCRNFDKSFVKCVRTKDFVSAASDSLSHDKTCSCLCLVAVVVFPSNRTSVEQA